jgi:hypothetical protein
MELTDDYKRKIASWIDEGMKLSDIQARLAQEDDLHLTYMQIRLLVDDLKLTPKDVAPQERAVSLETSPISSPSAAQSISPEPANERLAASAGGVAVKVDEITRPGALVSGNVTFSDGKKAAWHLDQMGRLGMVPEEQGYRPPQKDVAEFQLALEKELVRLGI